MRAPRPTSAIEESHRPRWPMASLSRSAAKLALGNRASARPAIRALLRLLITGGVPSGAALHHAVGLDRDFGVGRWQVAPEYAGLPVALPLAGNLHVVGAHFLAEARNLVGAKRVSAGHHATAILYPHGHFDVRHGGAGGVLHEAEIGGTLVLAGVVVVAEAGAAGPQRGRHDTQGSDQTCDLAPATI